ncbi:GNAT family N-acetyltransferase [Paenibacillus psychroresistens]|uniref:GNAT family N-acetyltransferase n=2 Tax=Paenibacillus psychroresistens TaxID=1778678 RepID=A0A6B8RYI2_9BACL|nr:GNAT family N-acetyltransferase [Paenibacillus psychroresistens]
MVRVNSNLSVKLAETITELEQAYQLRYRVFVEEEKNLRLINSTGLETDSYDAFCDHLIVVDEDNGVVVGTYRLLPGERVSKHIGFYSQTEFDLTTFSEHTHKTLELGRSCIAEPYRGGRAIQLLWEGIAIYIAERGYEYLIGCASVHIKNETELNEIYSLLKYKHVITERYGIQPLPSHRISSLCYIDVSEREKEIFRKLPPLMKGYQWLGAQIGGDPAYDAVFETVDFFIVLHKDQITRRYRKHFIDKK